MPVLLNWLLRLLPTNPICMRLVQGGSRRLRHLYIRSGYLAVMMLVLLFVLLGEVGGGSPSLRNLASGGARMFELVSYLQIALICLLTPVFMAGAIAQEANPQTWDILLTTPLNNLQVVLGNLFGRLFFVIALLFASLPLFAVTQYFGGVPGESIFASYAIAGASALLVAAIAVTLSVTRTAGRRAVFLFYISVVMYMFITYMIDVQFLRPLGPVGVGGQAYLTTLMTPLNPFLALEVLLRSNNYVPHDLTGTNSSWITHMWLTRPIATFCWLCVLLSLAMVAFSTIRARIIGAKLGSAPWYRKLLGLTAKGTSERPGRTVSHNPVAWRESAARGKSLPAVLARWGFVFLGIAGAIAMVTIYHTGLWNGSALRAALTAVITAELIIITLVALNMSATAVAHEREDGSLDILLTTPIQPGPYIYGKLRGLITFLVPMLIVPFGTMLIVCAYVAFGGFDRKGGVMHSDPNPSGTGPFAFEIPVVLPEAAILLPIMFAPFLAFCVMIGLHWSIKSKGTISSVIMSVGALVATMAVVSFCAGVSGGGLSYFGAVLAGLSPVNFVLASVTPAQWIPSALGETTSSSVPARVSLGVGAFIAAGVYSAIVYGMHSGMKRTFMTTVRRLAGTA